MWVNLGNMCVTKCFDLRHLTERVAQPVSAFSRFPPSVHDVYRAVTTEALSVAGGRLYSQEFEENVLLRRWYPQNSTKTTSGYVCCYAPGMAENYTPCTTLHNVHSA
jgi:hypothetical protein